ncbi:MAG TPA: sensor histidine kinase [Terriglobales bacterium]|nr:sensor histidine kinase [Terriglobales bacterium]
MLIASTALLSFLTFGMPSTSESPALLYTVVPFLLWSALRFGSIGITSSMMIISFLSIWGVVHGKGPFNAMGAQDSILSLQLFLIVAAIPFLVLTAFVEDRKVVGERLASLTRGLIEAQEQERARIGRELHDDINQRLAMLVMELDQLPDNPTTIQTSVRGIREEVLEISSDVQALSHELHSSKLEYLGVVVGMKSWCREFAEKQAMEIDFNSNVKTALPLDIGVSLFRVLQEALHNAVKHSGAKRVEVQLLEDSSEIHLIVSDLGKGFDVEAAMQGKGLGLTSMRERISLVSGKITIKSKPTGGATIHARVPLELKQLFKQKAV